MAVAGTAFVNFKGDYSELSKGARRFGSSAGTDYSSHFTKSSKPGILGGFRQIAGAGAAIFAGAKVVSLFGDFITEARESAKVGRITANAIRVTGGAANVTAGQIGKLSTAISNKTGIDDEQIQTAANMLLTFKAVQNQAGRGGKIFDRATQAAADLSVQFGGIDGASKQLGKALQDPVKGIGALGRAGVTFSATQKLQIKNFVKTGDLLSAQKIILGEVEGQVGGAAAAAADPMQKLSVIVSNLKERIGTALLPVIEKVANWLGTFLPKALDWAAKAFASLREFIAPVARVVKSLAGAILGGLGIAFTWFTDTAVPAVKGAFSDLIAGFKGGDSGGFFGTLGEKAAVVYAWITETAFPAVKKAFKDLIAGFKGEKGSGVFGTIGRAVKGLVTGFGDLLDASKPVFGAVARFVKSNPKPVFAALGAMVLTVLVPAFISWAVAAGAAAVATLLAVLPIVAVVAGIGLLVGAIVYAYQNFTVFRTVVDTVFRVIKTVVMAAIGFVVNLFKNVLLPAVMAVGGFFMNVLWPIIKTVFSGIVSAISMAWGIIKPVFMAIFTFVVDQLGPIFSGFLDVAKTVFSGVLGAVQTAWDFVKPIFEKIVSFVNETLIPIWDKIAGAVSSAFDKIPGIIRGALRIAGNVIAGFLRGAAGIADAISLGGVADALRGGAARADGWGEDGGGQNNSSRRGNPLSRAVGGPITGGVPNKDSVLIRGMPGEYVQRKSAVDQWGMGAMERLNRGQVPPGWQIPGFAVGGGILTGVGRPSAANTSAAEIRAAAAGALEKVWPKLPVPNNLMGVIPGAPNYIRSGLIDLIRGEPDKPMARGGPMPISTHSRNFDTGGVLDTGWNMVRNDTGKPERLTSGGRTAPMIGEAHFHDGVDLDAFIQKVTFAEMAGSFS